MFTFFILCVLLLVALIVTIYRSFSRKGQRFEKCGVPYIKPTYDNQLGILFGKRCFLDHMQLIYNQFPEAKYFGSSTLAGTVVVLRDPELIKDVTVKNFDNFTDHFSFSLDDLDPLFSKNLFSLRGQKWREHRAILSPSFTGMKLKGMFNLINQCATNFKEFLLRENKETVPLDTKDLFARYTNDVIASIAFGISVDSLKDRNNEFYLLGKRVTKFGFLENLKVTVSMALPFLARVLRLRIVSKSISDFFINTMKMNVQTRDSQQTSRPDMIQLMMQSRDDPRSGTKMDLVEMTANSFIFFFAGFDTISNAMCFTAHLLAANPDVQEKLLGGIKERYEAICDESRGYDALKDFSYLDAVISETLRLYPPNVIVGRICTKRYEFPPAVESGNPFVMEPDGEIWIPVSGIHYDQEYYQDPEKFIPERFLDSNGNLKTKVTDSPLFMPFGTGPRICIAHRFAMLEIKLVLTHLLALYELLPSDKTPNPPELVPSNVPFPKTGFWLHLKPRKKND